MEKLYFPQSLKPTVLEILLKSTFEGTKLIALTQVHTHNKLADTNRINIPDKNTSNRVNIPIHAIDSYLGAQKNGNAIHRVIPNGIQTNNIGTTNNQNIGRDALKMFIDKQKNP